MARVELTEPVQDTAGNVLPGATVQVNVRGGAAATLYNAETGATTVGNPRTSGAAGQIDAWVDEGSYTLVTTKSGYTFPDFPFEAAKGEWGRPLSVLDYVRGDGTDEYTALQTFLSQITRPEQVYFPKAPVRYGTSDTLVLPEVPGLKVTGSSRDVCEIRCSGNNRPVMQVSGQTQHSVEVSDLWLSYTTQQTDSDTNSTGLAFAGTNGAQSFYHKIDRLRIDKARIPIGLKIASGEMAFWNGSIHDVICSAVARSVIDLASPVATGNPTNLIERITCINSLVPTSYALRLVGEFVLDSIDIEDWSGALIYWDSGTGSVRGLHVERHALPDANTSLIHATNGTYEIGSYDIEVNSSHASSHNLINANGSAVELKPGRLSWGGSGTIYGFRGNTGTVRMYGHSPRMTSGAFSGMHPPAEAGAVALKWVDGDPGIGGCRAKRDAVQSVGSGVFTAVVFTGEDFATPNQSGANAFHDNVTNNTRMTAPVAGVYRLVANIAWAASATGPRWLRFRKNGSDFIAGVIEPGPDATNACEMHVTTEVKLAATDYIETMVRQDSGGNLDLAADNMVPRFTMTYDRAA